MDKIQDIYKNLNSLIGVAKLAAEAVMNIYNSDEFEIKEKNDQTPVTTADIIANKIICDGLSRISSYPIISEESEQVSYEIRSAYQYFWLIDPIDGTKEFIKKNGEFTINIALIKNQYPVLGIVMAPAKSELYYAVEGYGAYFEKNGITCRLKCGSYRENDEQLRIPVSMSYLNQETKEYISKYKNHIRIPKGAALKFMMIANNEAEIYPRMAPTMEWDTAAPQIIVEEAGGMLIDYNTNERLRYNKLSQINPSFITKAIQKP